MNAMPAVCLQSTKPEDLQVIEAPIPVAGPGQVLLRPLRTGVCGSDLSAFLGKRNFDWVQRPRILGHEYSAVIETLGPGVEGFELGQLVTSVAMQSCLTCPNCRRGDTNLCRDRQIIGFHRDGAMAARCVCDTRYVMPILEGLTPVMASLIEPLSVASRCIARHSGIRPGDSVLVTGPGIIGMLCALLARSAGGRVSLVGVEGDRGVRLKKAEELGFDTLVVGPDALLEAQLDEPADHLVEASGAPPALASAHKAVRYGGRLHVVATYGQDVTLDKTATVRSEQFVQTTMGSNWDDFMRAQRHLLDGVIPVDSLVEEFALADAVAAFEASRDRNTQKAVLVIPDSL